MYWVLLSLSLCCLLLGGWAMTTDSTASTASTTSSMPTTTRGPLTCHNRNCNERGCLATEIENSSPSTCTTLPQGYCAIHVVSNTSYYEVTASCESACEPAGNRESATATYCCTMNICNNDEDKLPEASGNGAGLWSLKWTLVFAMEVIVVFLPLLSLC